MIVVFDTNIWKSELYLQSPSGAAVRFFLREQKARVGLPEVVRLEVEEHLRGDIKSVIDKLRTQHSRLLRLFGQLRELSLPAEDAIDAIIEKVFGELGVEVVEVPFSLPSARSSWLSSQARSIGTSSTARSRRCTATVVGLGLRHGLWSGFFCSSTFTGCRTKACATAGSMTRTSSTSLERSSSSTSFRTSART
jgi:hypothetical protein